MRILLQTLAGSVGHPASFSSFAKSLAVSMWPLMPCSGFNVKFRNFCWRICRLSTEFCWY